MLGALIASRQPKADPSVFEYGIERSFEGQIVEHPYPALLVPRPGSPIRGVAYSRYLLVAAGKHGAQEIVKGLDGGGAELKGSADLPRWGDDGRGGTRGEQAVRHQLPRSRPRSWVASLCTARSWTRSATWASCAREWCGPPRLRHALSLRRRSATAHRPRLHRPGSLHSTDRPRRSAVAERRSC